MGGSGGAWFKKKRTKKTNLHGKYVKINANKKVDKGTRLYTYLTVVGDCVTLHFRPVCLDIEEKKYLYCITLSW